MMLDTADNKIFFPRFYDIDTICSYDNSGQLKFDVDIEMEQGYWNTSSSRLWTRIRDLMHDDIVTTYNNMRQNGVSYENMMKYIYDEQIAKIPQTYYNKDYDVKYAPFADSYIGMAHGDTYEHVKRWLKQRFTFVDTLFDYAPSYNNDILTIRANTTELMTLEIETYTPVYLHLSWYNGQMDKKKIDGKVSVEFSGKAQAATDQEVLIYGGSNVKSIKGIQSANPNRLILGSATKLTELDASNCPLLTEINMNKANLSPHEYLNKVNLSNCPLLEGNLRLNNSPLIQELDIRGTNITGMNLSSSIRNLQVLRLPNTMTELTLNDASMLHTLEFDEGVALQSISMTNCNALENVINFDLLQTPSITLNNSYNNVAELYFRDTTNLSLSNMSNLERVIYTPNNEYETFEMINVANAPDYKITTFNCPKLSTFMTTAPYRESYNNVSGYVDKELSVINWSEFNGNVSVLTDTVLRPNTGLIESLSGNIATEFFIHVKEGESYTVTSNGGWLNVIGYDENKDYKKTISPGTNIKTYTFIADCPYIKVGSNGGSYITIQGLVGEESIEIIQIKDYGNIQPNTTFTANSIDISSTQFTDVKLLCTTDTNTLKLPTTVKNFYCDSSFDLDTDYLEDGEYDVVHGELVVPYTYDYESEVVRVSNSEASLLMKDICTIPNSYIHDTTGEVTYHYAYSLSDFIEVVPSTRIKLNFWVCRVSEFNADKRYIKNTVLYNNGTQKLILDSNCKYIRVYVEPNYLDDINVITCTPLVTYVPNLIPSSADGSLIFSMYAPNNTVTPVSGTWDLHGLKFDNFHTFGMNNDVKQDSEGNISMPARYDDYNITIKNANISPKTHNTMLYPLLVNEDNPIEGKLDYTNYTGNNLSWSFAYVNMNKVNIVQPKDELLNTYEYRYNAFYETEYEFDDPNEVLKYITSSSNLLPTFNEGFTYTYDKLDNNDGTYIYRIYANDPTLLTSFELEKVPYLRITNAENLLSPIDLTKYEVVEIDNSYSNITELYFRDSTNLTLSNMSNLERVIYLPNDEYEMFELINVANAPDYKITTFNCPKLSTFMTTAPYRESYNNISGYADKEVEVLGDVTLTENYSPKGVSFIYDNIFTDFENDGYIEVEVDLSTCINTFENIISFGTGIDKWTGWTKQIHMHYSMQSAHIGVYDAINNKSIDIPTAKIAVIRLDAGGVYINGTKCCENSLIGLNSISIGSQEGSVRSNAFYNYIKYCGYHSVIVQVKDYGDIQPNTAFTANSIDISNTQFTDVKLLCTTDTNTLKLPTTVKNFYCDSSFDLDTDYLEDGEYDVVHGELVEPYTTDYEGEVNLSAYISEYMRQNGNVPSNMQDNYRVDSTLKLVSDSSCATTQILPVPASKKLTIKSNGTNLRIRIGYYNADKVMFAQTSSTRITTPYEISFTNDVSYFVITYYKESSMPEDVWLEFETTRTPNLIPSSVDGSLIFSMYAPINTVAPASGTWDLKGLEFDNFHTFGMNNDVKQDSEGNISMPARYDDYNITIKNANITPKTHNTMLYPLLVNENNPITGTLDYTNYAGKHLSWSFAYTDKEFVDVTTDNDLSNVEYFYNLAVESDLNVDILVNILNTLPHVNSEVLNIGSTNLAKLTEEQIAIATNKGWTVV